MVSPSAFFFPPRRKDSFSYLLLGRLFSILPHTGRGYQNRVRNLSVPCFFVYTKPAICSAARTP